MIPTITDIVEGLLSGEFTKEQAIGWLRTHADLDTEGLRDHFAGQALAAMHLNDTPGETDVQLAASAAFQYADAMLVARTR